MRPGHATALSHHSDQDQHRNKRQYQPPITRFFASYRDLDSDSESEVEEEHNGKWGSGPNIPSKHQHNASTSSARRSQTHRDSVIPNVPDRVQAGLLSVGMRVRKSVPEGYKTHKTATLPTIQTTLSIAGNGASSTTTMTATQYSVKPPQDAVPDDYQHQRELLPFCGLQKIGGYAQQPITNVHLYGGTSASGERAANSFPLPAEAFTQPFSSQSSTDSSFSTSSLRPNPTNPYKRSWHDEDDNPVKLNSDFFFKVPVKVSEDEIPVSPMSETPPMSIHGLPQTALRPFAQPKTRRHGAGRTIDFDGMVVKEGDVDMDLENAGQMEGRILVGSPGDFGEAEFLQPWGANREVDMGGV